jgi:hypothetical protein
LVVGDSDELMGTSSSSSAAHQTGLLAAREELGSMREETASERGNFPREEASEGLPLGADVDSVKSTGQLKRGADRVEALTVRGLGLWTQEVCEVVG